MSQLHKPTSPHVPAGHFYLIKLLLPLLIATAQKCPPGTVRVVNVSSIGHYMGAPEVIQWSTLASGNDSLEPRTKLGTTRLYGQSKMVRIMDSLPTPPLF